MYFHPNWFFLSVILLLLSGCSGFNDPPTIGESEKMQHLFQQANELPPESVIVRRTHYARPQNRPKIFRGNSGHGVILLHGFIGSPFEVMELVPKLQQKGFTALLPWMYRFGGDTESASGASLADWRQSLLDAIDLLARECDEISLVGFSLGGGLMVDYLLRTAEQEGKNPVHKIVLVAPYCRNYMFGGRALASLTSLFTSSLPLSTLYSISHHGDLMVPASYPEYFNKDLPLQAVSTIFDLGDALESSSVGIKSSSPVLALLSEKDAVVDAGQTTKFLHHHFADLSIINYPSEKEIRHQILIRDTNPYLQESLNTIVSFLAD